MFRILVLAQVLLFIYLSVRTYTWEFHAFSARTVNTGLPEYDNCEILTSGNFFLPNGKNEQAQNVISKIPVKILKNNFNKFIAQLEVTENLIFSSLSKYILLSVFKAEKFLVPDIIYPFHYHW
jgi:hypothetical protein